METLCYIIHSSLFFDATSYVQLAAGYGAEPNPVSTEAPRFCCTSKFEQRIAKETGRVTHSAQVHIYCVNFTPCVDRVFPVAVGPILSPRP